MPTSGSLEYYAGVVSNIKADTEEVDVDCHGPLLTGIVDKLVIILK